MADDKVDLQKKWFDTRYEIIDRLDQLILAGLKSYDPEYISPEVLSKIMPARIAFFNELIQLSDRTHLYEAYGVASTDVKNAYNFAAGEGGNA